MKPTSLQSKRQVMHMQKQKVNRKKTQKKKHKFPLLEEHEKIIEKSTLRKNQSKNRKKQKSGKNKSAPLLEQ